MKTALVLGGGGPIGVAWEAGLLLGLKDQGADLSAVDLIVGTSAGAIVGSYLAFDRSPEPLFSLQALPMNMAMQPPRMGPVLAAFIRAKLFHRGILSQRKSIGKSALKAHVSPERAWLESVQGFLPPAARTHQGWPNQDLWLTAIDVESGERIVWTRASGVPLPLAVASSCAVPCVYPLVHVRGRTCMDGGIGSPTNGDLAEGYDLIVILDPLAHLPGRKNTLRGECDKLSRLGSKVICFSFSASAKAVVGINLMDAARREPAAVEGRQQGRAASEGGLLRQCLGR